VCNRSRGDTLGDGEELPRRRVRRERRRQDGHTGTGDLRTFPQRLRKYNTTHRMINNSRSEIAPRRRAV